MVCDILKTCVFANGLAHWDAMFRPAPLSNGCCKFVQKLHAAARHNVVLEACAGIVVEQVIWFSHLQSTKFFHTIMGQTILRAPLFHEQRPLGGTRAAGREAKFKWSAAILKILFCMPLGPTGNAPFRKWEVQKQVVDQSMWTVLIEFGSGTPQSSLPID